MEHSSLIEGSEIGTDQEVEEYLIEKKGFYFFDKQRYQISPLLTILVYALPSIFIQALSPIIPTIYSIPLYIMLYVAVTKRK